MLETLLRDGLVCVPLLLRVEFEELQRISDTLYQHFSAGVTPESDAEAKLRHTHDEWQGLQLDHVQEFLPWQMEPLLAEAETRIKDWFGQAYRIQPQISFFRRCRSGAPGSVSWHCDAEAASTINVGTDCINAWVPLDPVGKTLPSLELVVGSHKVMDQRPENDYDGFHRTDAWVAGIAMEHVTPVIETLGEALVFSQFTLHRTQLLESSMQRRSCELRFCK